jgi:predicted O-methyltransferase YrrM
MNDTRTMRADIEQALSRIPIDFGGGCSVGKAGVMAELITTHGLDTAVEIGVYRGRSFIPLALAMRAQGRGRAFGVDPYAVEPAMQHDDHGFPSEALHAFARDSDWDGIWQSVEEAIDREHVRDFAELLRTTSLDAASRFAPGTVGLVHIDGNHDRASVERDISMWLPRIKPDGFLVLDDASWDSISPSVRALSASHELMLNIDDKHGLLGVGGSDFAVLRVAEGPLAQPAAPGWGGRIRHLLRDR